MKKVILVLFCLFIVSNIFSLEIDDENSHSATKFPAQHSFFLLPLGYDFISLGGQKAHLPVTGIGFLSGEQDLPFDEIERSIFGIAMYRPVIFAEAPFSGIDSFLHQIDFLLDWRIKRHQLLFIFKSASDNPITGGLNTFQSGVGWGYELIRKPNVSLILGGALCVGDFGITLPNGEPLPVMPLPLIRFNVISRWFNSSFDFLSGPNLEITIAPKERIRFTADMRMDDYRSIYDLIYECILWYRLFDENHQFGDFAGIGIGVKNESNSFTITRLQTDFDFQYNALFAVLDLSFINIQGGWVFDSRYMIDGKITDKLSKGFYLSIQGIIPFSRR